MKSEEVVGIFGPFQVDTALEDWYLVPMWTFPINSQMAGWNDALDILTTLIHRVLRNLQSMEKFDLILLCQALTITVITFDICTSKVAQQVRKSCN